MKLKKGDIFIQYTDGVTEATNIRGEEFSEERLIESIRNSKAKNSGDVIKKIVDTLKKFTGKTKLRDDMTIVSFSVD